MKKTFEAPELVLVRIGEQDILTTSTDGREEQDDNPTWG